MSPSRWSAEVTVTASAPIACPAGTFCFARATDQVVQPKPVVPSNAFVKTHEPPPTPGPPTPVNTWTDKVACTYLASAVSGSSTCNGWTGGTTEACVAKCVASVLPAGCAADTKFRCAYAQWEPSKTDPGRCQVAAKNCTPVGDPDVWHPPTGGGPGRTALGGNLWKMSSCVLKPGEPKPFAPVCAEMANATTCATVSQTCEWDDHPVTTAAAPLPAQPHDIY